MDGIVTLLSVVGAMLLAGAYAFFISGAWAPAAADLLGPRKGAARTVLSNIGNVAVLGAVCWILLFMAA